MSDDTRLRLLDAYGIRNKDARPDWVSDTLCRAEVPFGAIILWSGSEIPSGWALCDGTNGTPDLRDRFVVGAGSTYSVGDTGGSFTTDGHTLTEAEMPSHAHAVNYDDSGGGGLTVQTTVGDTKPPDSNSYLAGYTDVSAVGATPPMYTNSTGNEQTVKGVDGFDITKFSMASAGSDQPHAHSFEPPYYALAYIMKV